MREPDRDRIFAFRRDQKRGGQKGVVGRITAAVLVAEMPEVGTIGPKRIAALAGVAPINHDGGQVTGRGLHRRRQTVGALRPLYGLPHGHPPQPADQGILPAPQCLGKSGKERRHAQTPDHCQCHAPAQRHWAPTC